MCNYVKKCIFVLVLILQRERINMVSSKIWIIIKHEYVAKIKTKGFIISTIAAPVFMVAIIAIPAFVTYLTMSSDDKHEKIAIVDKTDMLAQKIIGNDATDYFTTDEPENILQNKILNGEISGALILNENTLASGTAKILTSENTGLKFIDRLRDKVNAVLKEQRLAAAGISQETIDLVNANVQFETIKVTAKGVEEDNSEFFSTLGYILGFVMYGLMVLYGQQVMQSVIEEKSNRIIEVLASSAKPFQIMFGKVVGIGAVGLTQVVAWLAISGIALFFAGQLMDPASTISSTVRSNPAASQEMISMLNTMKLPTISPLLVVGFIFYFLSGYFIYATLFAAIGSSVDQLQDAGSLSAPLTLVVILPILCIPNVMLNPEGTLAVVLSLFPFFSPILMVARVAAISVPLWQIILSVVLLVATFICCLKAAAKIYRVAMLSYGKKPSFKDIFKWTFAK